MLELFAVLSNVYIAIDQRQRMLHSLGILEQGFILLESANILTSTIQNGKQLLENIDMVESRLDEYILAPATDQVDMYSKENANST